MIKITNLTKSYGKKKVLENLNCTIKTGSIYGLVGANGAGKSTLLRIINDVFDKDSGTIEIDGNELIGDASLKQKLVFVPDDLFFFSGYTLLDMALFYKDMYEKFDLEYVKELAGILKLNLNEKINNFSKGMKRQCALICAIATNADYMFFDETFDGVDPVVRTLLKKIIVKQMEKKETTIIMTSHNLRELEDICDSYGLLDNMEISSSGYIQDKISTYHKYQVAFERHIDKDLFDINFVNYLEEGRVIKFVCDLSIEDLKKKIESFNPLIIDEIPIDFEELFIIEVESRGYLK